MANIQDIRDEAKRLGMSVAKFYLSKTKERLLKLSKKFPILYNAIFRKRYILPKYREEDYVSQEACDYMIFDMILSMAIGDDEYNSKDEVLNTTYVSMIRQMEFDRPIFFLEKELGRPMLKTKLPGDYYISDIKWKFPAIRIYLPKDLLCLERDGKKSSLMYLDITKIEKETIYDMSKGIKDEVKNYLGINLLPPFKNAYEGFGVSGNLDFDSDQAGIGYAGSSPLDGVTVKNLVDAVTNYDLNKSFPSDEIDRHFVNRMLTFAINILLYLSSYPVEYEIKKSDIIRPPKQEGKRTITGLYKAKFVGESQLRPYRPSQSKGAPIAPTGKEIVAHYVAGHWKRVWYGPGKKENRLQWIGLYHTGEIKENNLLVKK